MKNEIKEILNQLEKVKDGVGTFIGIDNKGAKLLLDYITNLQEELNKYKFPDCKSKDIEVVRANLVDMMRKNKRLEQENEILKENAIHNDKVVDKAKWNEMLYKSRNEKAIDLLKYDMENFDLEDGYLTCEEVLNILEGDDKNVKD